MIFKYLIPTMGQVLTNQDHGQHPVNCRGVSDHPCMGGWVGGIVKMEAGNSRAGLTLKGEQEQQLAA